MLDLVIIADDFTGALDTGVQCAKRGVRTCVIADPYAELSKVDPAVRVLVMDAETRHAAPQQAYNVIHRAVKQAKQLGVPYIYKKTDSALRGNIGAELTALLDASDASSLPFFPAFPQIGRYTIDGIQYIDGIPVAESVFGQDPYEPVKHSSVIDLIAEQSTVRVTSVSVPDCITQIETGIVVYDAQSTQDLVRYGGLLLQAGQLGIMAGCAGFGSVLPDLLGLGIEQKQERPVFDPKLLVLCGSVNPITLAQLRVAQENGFVRKHIAPAHKLTNNFFSTEEGLEIIDSFREMLEQNEACIIDTNDEYGNEPTQAYAAAHGMNAEAVRQLISGALGDIMKQLFDCPALGTLFITGGDTLLQCMKRIGVLEVEPIGEMLPGVVISRFTLEGRTRFVITKSGGFGSDNLLLDLKDMLRSDL